MNLKRTIAMAGLGAMCLTVSVAAHHAFSAEFDQDKPVMLEGSVTKADWTNPHAWIYVDVKKPDGTVEQWKFEAGTPNVLFRRGFTKASLMPGTPVMSNSLLLKTSCPRAIRARALLLERAHAS